MPKSFPKIMMGQCPQCTGGGSGPDTGAGSAFSSNQIETNEDVPLEYSSLYEDYVCVMHRRKAEEENGGNERFTKRDAEIERRRQRMGFSKTYTVQS